MYIYKYILNVYIYKHAHILGTKKISSNHKRGIYPYSRFLGSGKMRANGEGEEGERAPFEGRRDACRRRDLARQVSRDDSGAARQL